MADDIDNPRPDASSVARIIAILALALAIAAGTVACGPDRSVPPSSSPWAACPHGEHRIRDGWLPWGHQWACE